MADAIHAESTSGHAEGGHGHAHGDLPFLAHHFETPAQQFDAGKLGMWIFLVTEVLFFAGLFCAYAVYRRTHPQIFIVGQHFLDVKMGALNTIVLILSSFTMAMGVWCAQTSRRKGLLVCLILTWLGAAGFMGVKFVEYSHKFHDQIIWGKDFNPTRHVEHEGGAEAADAENAAAPAAASTAPAPAATGGVSAIEHTTIASAAAGPQGLGRTQEEFSAEKAEHHALDAYALAAQMRDLHIFMGIYFCLTGLHGFHVLAGMIVIAWLIHGAFKGRYDGKYYTPVDLVGLYWHVVDLVWIFLFPLLYLIH